MTTLLMVTAGRTDLQVVVNDNGREVRTTPGDLRAFHESLLGDRDWVVDEAAVGYEEFSDRPDIAPSARDCIRDNEERIRLVPAKLKPILDRFDGIDAAVVLASRRDAMFKNEPVAVGPVLAGWIEARNRGDLSAARQLARDRVKPWDPSNDRWPGGAQWVNLLRGTETFEGDDLLRPVSRQVVDRLHATLDRLRNELNPDKVIIARTGAFPDLKQLVVAATGLIFGPGRVIVAEVPERLNKVVQVGANLQKSPEEAYRLREAALSRIRRGDLEGAAAFAARALDDEWESHWAGPVVAAADWLAGRGPVPAKAPKYLQHLNNVSLRCFLAAARAEAALLGDRIHEAVISSVTFFDAALLDAIQGFPWVSGVDELNRILRAKCTPPSSLTERGLALQHIRNDEWSYHTIRKAAWISEMHHDMRDAFQRMQDALQNGRPPIVNYRHMAVHGRLVGKYLDNAEKAFRDAGIWSQKRFLYSGGPASEILAKLGGPGPGSLDTIFKELENEILRRRFGFTSE